MTEVKSWVSAQAGARTQDQLTAYHLVSWKMTDSRPLIPGWRLGVSGRSTRQREQDWGCRGRPRGQERRHGAQQEQMGLCSKIWGAGTGGRLWPRSRGSSDDSDGQYESREDLSICSQPEALSSFSLFDIYRLPRSSLDWSGKLAPSKGGWAISVSQAQLPVWGFPPSPTLSALGVRSTAVSIGWGVQGGPTLKQAVFCEPRWKPRNELWVLHFTVVASGVSWLGRGLDREKDLVLSIFHPQFTQCLTLNLWISQQLRANVPMVQCRNWAKTRIRLSASRVRHSPGRSQPFLPTFPLFSQIRARESPWLLFLVLVDQRKTFYQDHSFCHPGTELW